MVLPRGDNVDVRQQQNAAGNGGQQMDAGAHNLNEAAGGASNFIRPPKPLIVGGDTGANNWKLWIQQYEWFEIATNMQAKAQNVQVATFMSSIGTDAVQIFNTFGCTPEELANLDTVKGRFRTYFTPKTNITYERYMFNRMAQEDGESFDEFLTKVKTQSAKCGFNALHDSLLRDKIIIGIRSEVVREQLLADDEESTLDRVTNRCRASELASKQLRGLQSDASAVHAIQSGYSNRPQQRQQNQRSVPASTSDTYDCKRCGRSHGSRSCPAYKKRCNKCDAEGHFAQCCPSNGGARPKHGHGKKKVSAIEEQYSDDDDEDFFISSICKEKADTNRDDERHWFEEIVIEGIGVKVKLDSGAECNVIPKEVADKIGGTRATTTKRLITYSGDKMNVAGQIIAKTKVRGKTHSLKFIVVTENTEPVLGLPSCKTTGLIKRIDAIHLDQPVFEGLGCLKDFE